MAENSDLEAKIIDAVYRGACELSEMKRAVELFADYFHSPGVLLGELDLAQPNRSFVFGANTIDHTFFAGYCQWNGHDPAPRAYAALPIGKAAFSNALFSRSERRASPFLNEFLMPHGLSDSIGAPLLSEGGKVAQIGIFQDARRSYDDQSEILRLERLTPHLTRALQIRRLFAQSEARGKALESIVDRNETALIGLRGPGPPLFVNAAARAMTAIGDGIALDRQGRLVLIDRIAAKRLAALQANVTKGGAGGLLHVARPSGLKPYAILVSPLPSGDDLFPGAKGGILFAVHDPASRKIPTDQRIAELLHISLGAARVLQAILEGIELKDYAERAGITMNTVRFHLKSAFSSTGVHSQAELVKTVMAVLSDLGPYFPV